MTEAEQEEVAALEHLYRDTLLVRAQAAVLLKQRNYPKEVRRRVSEAAGFRCGYCLTSQHEPS